MKRQIFFGFTGALMLGAFSLLGACNKHSFEDGEFDKGVKILFQKHHAGGEGHGDSHGAGHGDAHADHGKDHGAGHGDAHAEHDDEGKAHKKQDAAKKPAKSLFPKK